MTNMLSRRGLLALAAPAVLLALPAPGRAADGIAALIEANDPVFGAIERHRKAVANHAAWVQIEGELEDLLPREQRLTDINRGGGMVASDDPRWIEAQVALSTATPDADDAAVSLLNECAPTTGAGWMALLAYYIEATKEDATVFPSDLIDEDDGNRWGRSFEARLLMNMNAKLGALL